MNLKSFLVLLLSLALFGRLLAQDSEQLMSTQSPSDTVAIQIIEMYPGSFGVGVGTKGLSFEFEVGFSRLMSARLNYGLSNLSVNIPMKIGDHDFDNSASQNLQSLGLVLNYYPFAKLRQRGFHLTFGGSYSFINELAVKSKIENTYDIAGTEITPEDIGEMTTKIKFSSFTPYVGFGFRFPKLIGPIGLGVYAGVFYQGSPTVEVEATKMLAPNMQNAAVIQENLAEYKFYPNINFTLTYTIF